MCKNVVAKYLSGTDAVTCTLTACQPLSWHAQHIDGVVKGATSSSGKCLGSDSKQAGSPRFVNVAKVVCIVSYHTSRFSVTGLDGSVTGLDGNNVDSTSFQSSGSLICCRNVCS